MRYRIVMWALAGLLVAGSWALFAFLTFPSTVERMRELWPLVSFTCPISILGMHHPISLYEALIANAISYALFALIVEKLRRRLPHAL